MRDLKVHWSFFILSILVGFSSILAGQGKIKGLFFGDYYYIARSHRNTLEGQNGFWFRRIYFTYDYRWNSQFAMRLRLEMAHPGDFTSSKTAVPFVKDAYLKYHTNQLDILLGISPTPTFAVIENVWGYRAVEKTPVDLQKMGSSRDFGLAVKGALNKANTINYHIMIGNGNSNKSETNSGKKVMASVGYYPDKGISVEAYGDYEIRSAGETRQTTQVFVAYRGRRFRAGLQLVDQQRHQNNTITRFQIASAFAVEQLTPNIYLLERIDRLPKGSAGAETIAYLPFAENTPATFILLGVDYTPIPEVHFIPNVETIVYDTPASATQPKNDIMLRFTVFATF